MGAVFFALPLVLINSDPLLEGVWQILLVFWPLGLFALAIFYVAARYACSWVQLRRDGLAIAGLWEVVDLPLSKIVKVRARERKLPGWIAPALVLVGGGRGAGVALLHAGRAAHHLDIGRKAAPSIRFSVDAFPGIDRVIGAFDRAGVVLDGELGSYARQIARRKARAS